MSPSVLGVEGEVQRNVSIKITNYMGLMDCSSVDSSASSLSDHNKHNVNLKATELRLGLPGSESPERDPELCLLTSAKLDEQQLFPLHPLKDGICSLSQKMLGSGNKRGYSDAMNGFTGMKNSVFSEGKWMFHTVGSDSEALSVGASKLTSSSGINVMLSPRASTNQSAIVKEMPQKALQDRLPGTSHNLIGSSIKTSSVPAAKAQVVGWPPVRKFRKDNLATTAKNNDEVDGKHGPGTLFIKVSMDGVPYLRKIDLRNYSAYRGLSSALEKMFSCFTLGQYGSHRTPGKERLSDSNLEDLLLGSEYVLAYEDKDGDWMLVGDVPWEVFTDSCMKLKIMKSSDAIGLAPRLVEKSKNRN